VVSFLCGSNTTLIFSVKWYQWTGQTTGHENGTIHNTGLPQISPPRLISPAKKLGKQGRQKSVALQQYHYHYLSEFSQSSLEHFHLTVL